MLCVVLLSQDGMALLTSELVLNLWYTRQLLVSRCYYTQDSTFKILFSDNHEAVATDDLRKRVKRANRFASIPPVVLVVCVVPCSFRTPIQRYIR